MSARRLPGRVGLAGLAAVVAVLALTPVLAPPRPTPVPVQLARFGGGGHFGSSRGFGLGSRPRTSFGQRGFARGPSRSRGILRRIGRVLAVAAIFHFLFAGSHGGGFLLLLVIIGLLVLVMRRRRRRVYQRY